MSVTGPGCAACDFTGYAPRFDEAANAWEDDMPCDACGGFSQFARLHNEALAGMRQPLADALAVAYQPIVDEIAARHRMPAPRVRFGDALSPEDDFRPLPSVAEVLAHNARTGGGFTSPWLCIRGADEEYSDVRVVSLSVGLAFGGEHDEVCGGADADDALYRPITRRGGALPWPEVPR